MDEPFFDIRTIGEVSVVRINADKLYQSESMRFREVMVDLLKTGCRRVVFDLRRVRVMNSSAIGVVLMSADQLKKRKGQLAVGGLNPMLRELFKRMYLHTLFVIAETPDQAVKRLAAGKKTPAT